MEITGNNMRLPPKIHSVLLFKPPPVCLSPGRSGGRPPGLSAHTVFRPSGRMRGSPCPWWGGRVSALVREFEQKCRRQLQMKPQQPRGSSLHAFLPQRRPYRARRLLFKVGGWVGAGERLLPQSQAHPKLQQDFNTSLSKMWRGSLHGPF